MPAATDALMASRQACIWLVTAAESVSFDQTLNAVVAGYPFAILHHMRRGQNQIRGNKYSRTVCVGSGSNGQYFSLDSILLIELHGIDNLNDIIASIRHFRHHASGSTIPRTPAIAVWSPSRAAVQIVFSHQADGSPLLIVYEPSAFT